MEDRKFKIRTQSGAEIIRNRQNLRKLPAMKNFKEE